MLQSSFHPDAIGIRSYFEGNLLQSKTIGRLCAKPFLVVTQMKAISDLCVTVGQ